MIGKVGIGLADCTGGWSNRRSCRQSRSCRRTYCTVQRVMEQLHGEGEDMKRVRMHNYMEARGNRAVHVQACRG